MLPLLTPDQKKNGLVQFSPCSRFRGLFILLIGYTSIQIFFLGYTSGSNQVFSSKKSYTFEAKLNHDSQKQSLFETKIPRNLKLVF